MKRFVNGKEVELSDDSFEVVDVGDRLIVKGPEGAFSAVVERRGDATLLSFKGRQYTVQRKLPRSKTSAASSGELRAPMPGQIVDVLVKEGDKVESGQKILVLEAMKTQQPFLAPFAGTVSKLSVTQGQQVNDGAVLAVVTPEEEK